VALEPAGRPCVQRKFLRELPALKVEVPQRTDYRWGIAVETIRLALLNVLKCLGDLLTGQIGDLSTTAKHVAAAEHYSLPLLARIRHVLNLTHQIEVFEPLRRFRAAKNAD